MGTLNAFYIRASNPSLVAAVRASYPLAYTETGSQFFAVDQPINRYQCPEAELRSLSDHLKTDVIWLSFQSVVDAFQYHRWQNGALARSLVYGCFDSEREWERAEGFAEEWEAAVLFAPAKLSDALSDRDSHEERCELERAYREQKIAPGDLEPSLDARETARSVAKFFELPGWSLADVNTR